MAKDFTDLEIWQDAHRLSLLVYKFTASFPKDELYGMISQLRRAAVSVAANIVEGYERHHFADQINLFVIARGSCGEVQALLMISRDIGYFNREKIDELIAEYRTLSKRINAYVAYKRKQR